MIKISKNKRLENGLYGLNIQYGYNKIELLFKELFNKTYGKDEINLNELEILSNKLHSQISKENGK